MIGLTEAVIGTALYLLWKGGAITKKSDVPPVKPKAQQTKPVEVKWPTTELPVRQGTTTVEHVETPLQAVERNIREQKEQQAHLDAQAHEAYQKAGADRKAREDIARKYKARQKALDDWKADIASQSARFAGQKPQ